MAGRWAILAGLIAASSSTAWATGPAQPLARLPLESYRKGVAARIEVGGKQRLFQLDTAGGLTVISPAVANDVGCQPWGSITGFHMTGAKISAPRCDAVTLRWNGQLLTSPLVPVMAVGSPESPLDGLLALDAFAGSTITIDFARRQLVIESAASAAERTARATAIPAHLAREIGGAALSVFVEAPTAKGPARLELDSGNGGTILVARPFLALLGLPNRGDGPQPGAFKLADGVTASGVIFSPDMVIDGNLGMPFLKDWVVTMDLKEGRVWLRRNDVVAPAGMGTPPPISRSAPVTSAVR